MEFKLNLMARRAGNSIVNKKISYLKDFFSEAKSNGQHAGPNPFDDLSVEKKGNDSIKFDEFTDEELILIFNPHTYIEYMKEPNYFWLPILALFTGARLNELAGISLKDIFQSSGVWVIKIPPERAKTENSVRDIPIHKKLIELGFLDFYEQVKAAEPFNNLLFSELVKKEKIRQVEIK
ncbi:hypothetical protein [Variovorax sp. E3]|uniref:hypothetical protein n=1 Tax=Variovorax sp. E3 TaxID=1914993 RepID=UPI0018DB4340|nr:hypothetical protein [Variovorax sp. E3]